MDGFKWLSPLMGFEKREPLIPLQRLNFHMPYY